MLNGGKTNQQSPTYKAKEPYYPAKEPYYPAKEPYYPAKATNQQRLSLSLLHPLSQHKPSRMHVQAAEHAAEHASSSSSIPLALI